jgi:hypothetical protein
MSSCTIWKHFAIPLENKCLNEISEIITSVKYKIEVDEIQLLIAEGKKENAKAKKQKLLAFTPSATFRGQRLLTNMEQYSGFIHLDFDNLTSEQLIEAFKIICSIPYTLLCFRSPSGNGLKVFVEVNTGVEKHDIAYKQVQEFYEKKLGIASDPKCKDVTRLCFMSHDPVLYKNLNNEKFEIKLSTVLPPPFPTVEDQSNSRLKMSGKKHCLNACISPNRKKHTQKATVMNLFMYSHQTQTGKAFRKKLLCNFACRNLICLKKKSVPRFAAHTHTIQTSLQSLQTLQCCKTTLLRTS